MKRKIVFLAVLFLSILLAGCISIPLGDGGKLEVSKDGVNVDLGEEEESDDKNSEASDKGDTGLEDEENVADGEEGKGEDKSQETETGSDSCTVEIADPRGNERALKQLAELTPPNFPLPDCTKVDYVNEGYYDAYEAVTVDARFVVEGYWADVFDMYIDYLEEEGFGPLEKNEKAEGKSAWVKGETPDYSITIELKQIDNEDDEELVEIRVYLYHYDTPRDE